MSVQNSKTLTFTCGSTLKDSAPPFAPVHSHFAQLGIVREALISLWGQ